VTAPKRKRSIEGEPSAQRAAEQASHVRRAVMRLSRRLRAARPARSLSHAKLSILGHLQTNGDLSATQLARLEETRLQSLTRVLADLERNSLIMRVTDASDRRRAIIRITPEGTRALAADMRHRDAWLSSAMDAQLTPTERALVGLAAELLARLAEHPAKHAPAPDTPQADEPAG
jgi:DNA-binding MarR family transcriptional regulator